MYKSIQMDVFYPPEFALKILWTRFSNVNCRLEYIRQLYVPSKSLK